MAKLFGQELTKRQILERVGNISQVAGVKKYKLEDGRKDSLSAVDIKNGSGLEITALPGRALDIANASYKGIPLAFMSKSGLATAPYYEKDGIEWLRTFPGGLLSTCGLTYAGAPSVDEGEALGLHGRISTIPADEVCAYGEWLGDDYVMKVSGKVTQSRVFAENISVTREISMKMGENKIYIEDSIENLGFEPQPFMIIYHMNFGFPLVDAGTRFFATKESTIGATEFANKHIDSFDQMTAPVHGIEEAVYYHKCYGDNDGYGHCSLINEKLNIGASLSFNLNELPNLVEWKMMGQGDYVVGMEPSNCKTLGRVNEKSEGTLRYIQPGEVKRIKVVVDILDGQSEIEENLKLYK